MEVDPVDASVVPLQHVLDKRVALSKQIDLSGILRAERLSWGLILQKLSNSVNQQLRWLFHEYYTCGHDCV